MSHFREPLGVSAASHPTRCRSAQRSPAAALSALALSLPPAPHPHLNQHASRSPPLLRLPCKDAGGNVGEVNKSLALALRRQPQRHRQARGPERDRLRQRSLAALEEVQGRKRLLLRRRKGTARGQGRARGCDAKGDGGRRRAVGAPGEPACGVVQRAAIRIGLLQLLVEPQRLLREC